MLPLIDTKELKDDDKIFGESYDSEEIEDDGVEDSVDCLSNRQRDIAVKQYGSEDGSESNADRNADASSVPFNQISSNRAHSMPAKSVKQVLSGDLFQNQ